MLSKLSKPASKMLLISSASFLCLVGTASWFGLMLLEKVAVYQDQLALAAAVEEREVAVQALYQLVAETRTEREALTASFLGVVEIAIFLEQIEQYARTNQLILQSGQLQEVAFPETDLISQVRIPFTVEGTRSDVVRFVELLETVPYHGQMEQLHLQTTSANQNLVSANLVIVLSYREYDRES